MKNKKKVVKSQTKRKKKDQYSALYLAVILGVVLLLEGYLMGVASTDSLNKGLEVLDVSSGVQTFMADSYSAVEPLFVQAHDINTFYQMAATETIELLDSSNGDVLMFPRGVFKFYQLASIEMEKMLDFSDVWSSWPQVAGTSITR